VTRASLPIVCAWCDRIRTAGGDWVERETDPGAAEATHGICPDCLAEVQRAACLDARPASFTPAVARLLP
jgi:hypothetical protein